MFLYNGLNFSLMTVSHNGEGKMHLYITKHNLQSINMKIELYFPKYCYSHTLNMASAK